MRARQGFTLIEVAITLAVIAILATAAVAISRNGSQNARVGAAAYELTIRLNRLRMQAVSDGTDLFAVVLDAKDNDATRCGILDWTHCTSLVVLSNVDLTAFSLDTLSASGTVTGAIQVDRLDLPAGIRFERSVNGAHPPAPFDAVSVFDADLTQTTSGRSYFALRFSRNGDVTGWVFQPTQPGPKPGFAFALGNPLSAGAAGERRGVLVGFPSAIVRSLPL